MDIIKFETDCQHENQEMAYNHSLVWLTETEM
jgi:hypothetical protein